MSATWVAGADGCRAGWVVALKDLDSDRLSLCLVEGFRKLLALPEQPRIIALDMPVGLLERAQPGGRTGDRAARRLLGWPRSSSVFNPPVRGALKFLDYRQALAANRASSEHNLGFSRQTFGLFPKLREVDELMSPDRQYRVKEVHPELCFLELNGGRALASAKKSPAGRARRRNLLEVAGFWPGQEALDRFKRDQAQPDDCLDALAACWSAERMARGRALRLPERPERDARGLCMEIWR